MVCVGGGGGRKQAYSAFFTQLSALKNWIQKWETV
jgi:hypothetical protein